MVTLSCSSSVSIPIDKTIRVRVRYDLISQDHQDLPILYAKETARPCGIVSGQIIQGEKKKVQSGGQGEAGVDSGGIT